ELTLVDIAATRRYDARRDCAAEPKRVADRDDPIADLCLITVAEADIREGFARIDLEHRQVGAWVAPDDFGGVFGAVLRCYLNLAGVADDMVVGHNVALGIDDKAGAERDPLYLAVIAKTMRKRLVFALLLLIEKPAQHVVERRIAEFLRQLIRH